MLRLKKKRKSWSHKGDFGYVLIVGGNNWYSGSPIFNAIPALRVGADIAVIVAPKRAADMAASYLPDIIAYPLAGDCLKPGHVKEILKIAKDFDSLIIGGGLGVAEETKKAVVKIISEIRLPIVIDADAIKAIANQLNIVKSQKVILTPNTNEFEKITGQKVAAEVRERKNKVKELAQKLNCTILLKGHVDVISNGKKVTTNKTGSVYMTKGGFGDTLAGIAGSLLAQEYDPFTAARLAAKINGQAGQLACQKHGRGVLASDIFEYIPKVIL